MKNITLSPAYGRDYRTRTEALDALRAGKDFIIEDVSNRWCGKPVNLPQLVEAGYAFATIRFNQNRHVTSVRVSEFAEDEA